MYLTFSSLVYSLVSAFLLMQILRLMMTRPEKLKRIHHEMLTMLVFIVFLRLLFPFDFSGCLIRSGKTDLFLSQLLCQSFFGMQGWFWLQLVYLLGLIRALHQYLNMERLAHHVLESLKQQAVRKSVKDYLPWYLGPDYPVYLTRAFSTPMVIAQGQSIILPDKAYTSKEIEMILCHELEHLYNCDGVYLKMFNLIKAGWWFVPLQKWFRSIFVLFCEIRVDASVTSVYDEFKTLEYCETMVSVARKADDGPIGLEQASALGFVLSSRDIFNCRVHFLITNLRKKYMARSFMLLLILAAVAAVLVLPTVLF